MSSICRRRHVLLVVIALLLARPRAAAEQPVVPASAPGLTFVDTGIENGSPLWYDVVDSVIRLHLLYDHERASPNRAAGHISFVLHGQPGTSLTLEFLELDNLWNGQPGSVAGELKTVPAASIRCCASCGVTASRRS